MRIGLFVPCFMDQFYPRAAMATAELLEKLGHEVVYPQAQTCCGQPMSNSGCTKDAQAAARHFLATFAGFEAVVAPSGSCVSMIRHHYRAVLGDKADSQGVRQRTWELSEFLTDIAPLPADFQTSCPLTVGFHSACHGLRELGLGECSERPANPQFSKPMALLKRVHGLKFAELKRPDECCGFGGTFCASETGVAALMGRQRLEDHAQAGTQLICSTDMSCLMHLDGLARRDKKPMSFCHLAEILNGDFAQGLPQTASLQGSPA